MTPFTQLRAIAAPIPLANVDTDMLAPAAFLKTVSRQGLGRALFHAARFNASGAERPEFPLNREPWRHARILVSLENFGCGSSREHAPWALLDFGIRCVIAVSFADIFYSNCCKNGILPIALERQVVDQLLVDAADAKTAELAIDLQQQTITRSNGEIVPFVIDLQRRARLLSGADDISETLAHSAAIASYEERVRADTPWLATTPLLAWRDA